MKKKNPIHAYKRLLAEDVDWDYRCLIALEALHLYHLIREYKLFEWWC